MRLRLLLSLLLLGTLSLVPAPVSQAVAGQPAGKEIPGQAVRYQKGLAFYLQALTDYHAGNLAPVAGMLQAAAAGFRHLDLELAGLVAELRGVYREEGILDPELTGAIALHLQGSGHTVGGGPGPALDPADPAVIQGEGTLLFRPDSQWGMIGSVSGQASVTIELGEEIVVTGSGFDGVVPDAWRAASGRLLIDLDGVVLDGYGYLNFFDDGSFRAVINPTRGAWM